MKKYCPHEKINVHLCTHSKYIKQNLMQIDNAINFLFHIIFFLQIIYNDM